MVFPTSHRRPANRKPPAWLKAGALVDYHSVIGGPVTRSGLVVRDDPFQSNSGTWVVFLNGVSGYVACSAVTLAATVGA